MITILDVPETNLQPIVLTQKQVDLNRSRRNANNTIDKENKMENKINI